MGGPAAAVRHYERGQAVSGDAGGGFGACAEDRDGEVEARMKTLMGWAVRLYPAAWRERYGAEFEALLEDVGPSGGDLWNVVRGAMAMQMTTSTPD